MPTAPLIEAEHLDKRFPSGTLALHDVRFSIEAGEFVSLLGPSGCGKSTVLRLVAGLDSPSAGRLSRPQAEAGFVFQEPTLMPWATVFDNVWLPLRIAGSRREAARPRIEALLGSVGLAGFARAYPSELSGGMKMRASIARALVREPRLLLMDEPFAALDELTRQKLNDDLLGWWLAGRFTSLFVTHSVFEAVYLSQRVLVMGPRPGRITAEIRVPEPYPRRREWRTSTAYAELCSQVSMALEQAVLGAEQPA
ncbi:ABC transporter ATP-binding protein [Eleftheria terrae]|uniref:ABC transporter ATP-binding protein n=1 Tax=Eleftheria terrae TaxID=1597781 RepID=UPI00263B4A51|nr:ABC transporter ATP-binding protein [Eleftheria terrae]WKB54875.1 ABC transporter ATP-binding protein [Eleftheria terrae]